MRFPIERFTLDNGLRVVLSEDKTHPVVAVNIWYNVGSRNEKLGRTGFAHLFEHMMFQGSQNVPDTQHIAHIERAGGSMNGSTWLDRTNYFETVPSNQLELALWLEADRMGFLLPAMTLEKLNNQRDVVKNERRWRVDNQPYGDWDERIQAMVYPPEHPYHHSVIGSMQDLDAATLEDVQEFFRTYYAPNNAVLTICGDFDRSRIEEQVKRYFGDIPGADAPPVLPADALQFHPLTGPVRVEVEAEVALPRVYAAFRIPPYGDDRFYTGDVLAHLLSGGKSSRLYRSLVREQRLAQSVVGFAFPIVTGYSMLVLWATAAPEKDLDQVEEALWTEVERFHSELADAKEVERVLTGIASRHIISVQKVGERADQISMFTTLFDDPDGFNDELDRYRSVDSGMVKAFAEAFLTRQNVAVLRYVPRGRKEEAA